mgnify:FL=1
MSKRKSIVILTLLTIVVAILGVMCFESFEIPGTTKDFNSILDTVGKGIDLSGGYYVVLEPEDSNGATGGDVLKRAQDVIRTRLDDKGYTEAVISVQDGNKIRVEIPQVDDDGSVLEIIGQTGELTFRDGDGKIWLNGEDHIKSAYVGMDNGDYVVVLNFTAKGQARFTEATSYIYNNLDDKKLYIYLGDTKIQEPTVQGELNQASAQITGYSSYEDAQNIATVIDSGKLPIKYKVTESRSISSKLGDNAISMSAIMGAIGLALICILLLVRYRGMGLAAVYSLIIYVLLYVVFLAIIPNVQLTLPGIAGILLSIGMAVDANIVIFERIREEYALNKTIEASIKQGFRHASVTVLDSNITTILAAIVLWIMCPGTIKGFAITLLIGIVLSVFASILVTRWVLRLVLPLSSNEEKFLNLSREGGNV